MEDFEDGVNPEQLDQGENRELQCEGCREFFPERSTEEKPSLMSHLKGNIDCQRGHGRGGYKRMLEAEAEFEMKRKKKRQNEDQTQTKKVTHGFMVYDSKHHICIMLVQKLKLF